MADIHDRGVFGNRSTERQPGELAHRSDFLYRFLHGGIIEGEPVLQEMNAQHGLYFLFPSRLHTSDHLSNRQYARIVKGWVKAVDLDPAMYGTHTMRRTKASLIYRRTKNLRAVQLLLGHTKLESTVRYLGIEVDDALEMAEQTEV